MDGQISLRSLFISFRLINGAETGFEQELKPLKPFSPNHPESSPEIKQIILSGTLADESDTIVSIMGLKWNVYLP